LQLLKQIRAKSLLTELGLPFKELNMAKESMKAREVKRENGS
jgi:glutaredoxin